MSSLDDFNHYRPLLFSRLLNPVSRLVEINGQPGIIHHVNGNIFSVMTLEIIDGYELHSADL